MAAENFQAKDDFGQVQRMVTLTTSATVITYTAKTGRAADDFVIDRVIKVDGTSGSVMVITIPNGVYYGQELLVILEVYAATSTVNANPSQGDNSTQLTAAGGWTVMQWAGSTIGWVEQAASAT